MREDGERAGGFDQAGNLCEVLPDDVGCWPLAVKARHASKLLASRQAVQRPERDVETSGAEERRHGRAMPMWFTQLHSAHDGQIREPVTASLNAFQVPVYIQHWRGDLSFWRGERREIVIRLGARVEDRPGRVVRVFGKRDCRKANSDRPGAGAFHRATRRIPGPFAVHVAVLREHQSRLCLWSLLVRVMVALIPNSASLVGGG